MSVRIGFVNAPIGEEMDYATLLPWLESEYPDGWVIVHGRPAHTGIAMAMLRFTGADTLEPMFQPAPAPRDGDGCHYCKHPRRDHDLSARVGCNHAMCVCFCFEERM